MIVKDIQVKLILTSKKTSTIEVVLTTNKGKFKASVPAGISTGEGEAKSLPAKKTIANIEKIIKPALLQGITKSAVRQNLLFSPAYYRICRTADSVIRQKEFDDFLIALDGTPDKSRLGANAILALSIAFYRGGRGERIREIGANRGMGAIGGIKGQGTGGGGPRPMFNLIEGGRHSDSGLCVQEFLVCPNLGSFAENLFAGKKIQKQLRSDLTRLALGLTLGDEGGFSPKLKNTEQALDILLTAIKKAGFAGKVDIALDIAANSFYQQGKYNFEGKKLSGKELAKIYVGWLAKYPIISIEDPFAENDFPAWQKFVRGLTSYIVGDDLTCTNLRLMRRAKAKNLCNAVIIKPNQIGSVSETLAACELAKKFDWKVIVSHRAAETTDSFIADLAVLVGAGFIKSGAPGPKERMAKYNRLLKLLK